ncbi:magnesium ion transporter [Clarireedia jacksonii]
MEKTPIKIPGKNNRDGRKSAVAARKALNRPRGRPLKLESGKPTQDVVESAPVLADAKKARSLKHLKSRRKMSLLEKLPTELLETIFLLCLNLALPNCSPIIGAKLSSDIIYRKLIIAAFDPTWDAYLGELILPGQRHEFAPPGDAALQSAIFRLRWARLPVVLRSKDIWKEKYAPNRAVESVTTQWLDKLDDSVSEDEGVRSDIVSAACILDNNFAEYSEFMKKAKEESSMELLNINLYHRPFLLLSLDVAEGTQIPISLLMGPWDEDALKYLFWFVQAGAKIDWVSSTSGEAALFGYKDAVAEGRIEIVDLLLLAGVREKLDEDLIMFTLKHIPAGKGFPAIITMIEYMTPEEVPIMKIMDMFRNDPDNEHEIEKLGILNEHY